MKEIKVNMDGHFIITSMCPTQIEFGDVNGNHYYFRYRFLSWRLEKNDKVIATGDTDDHLSSYCTWEEAKEWIKEEGFNIID